MGELGYKEVNLNLGCPSGTVVSKPCTAEQLALKAMQKQAALGAKHLKDAKADNDESGAAGVGAAPNGGEEGSENDDKAKVDAIVGLYNSTKSQNGGKK